jgi:hypothetical protein
MYFVVLNEEVLPQPYETEAAARLAAEKLAGEFEARHGAPAFWVIAHQPKAH